MLASGKFYRKRTYTTPTVEYLVIAGGGGTPTGSGITGGGGAGGYRTATGLSVTAGSAITVTVGGGGTRTRGLYQAVNSISPVVFLCFSDDNRLSVSEYNEHTHVIAVPKSPDHRREVDELNAQFHIACDDIIASVHCAQNNLLVAIYHIS